MGKRRTGSLGSKCNDFSSAIDEFPSPTGMTMFRQLTSRLQQLRVGHPKTPTMGTTTGVAKG
jgi:hypothetical protein